MEKNELNWFRFRFAGFFLSSDDDDDSTLFLLFPFLFRVQVDGDDETVEPEDLCENEDEDHSHEQSRLLRGPAHARVAHDADGVAGRETGQTDGQTGTEMNESPERRKKNN